MYNFYSALDYAPTERNSTSAITLRRSVILDKGGVKLGLKTTCKKWYLMLHSDHTKGMIDQLLPDDIEEQIYDAGSLVDFLHDMVSLQDPKMACFLGVLSTKYTKARPYREAASEVILGCGDQDTMYWYLFLVENDPKVLTKFLQECDQTTFELYCDNVCDLRLALSKIEIPNEDY